MLDSIPGMAGRAAAVSLHTPLLDCFLGSNNSSNLRIRALLDLTLGLWFLCPLLYRLSSSCTSLSLHCARQKLCYIDSQIVFPHTTTRSEHGLSVMKVESTLCPPNRSCFGFGLEGHSPDLLSNDLVMSFPLPLLRRCGCLACCFPLPCLCNLDIRRGHRRSHNAGCFGFCSACI